MKSVTISQQHRDKNGERNAVLFFPEALGSDAIMVRQRRRSERDSEPGCSDGGNAEASSWKVLLMMALGG